MEAIAQVPDAAIGVDVGGTFTDVVVLDRISGKLSVDKVLSTPDRLAEGILSGLEKVFQSKEALKRILPKARIVHATTQATNALIESKTATVGLITNRGFRDVIEIRRHYRTRLYDMYMEGPKPIVPRHLRAEIDARLDYTGEILKPIDPREVAAVIKQLKAAGVEAYAICLLHSYVRPDQETMIAKIGKAIHPQAYFTCSSEVCPEYREYERTSTAAVNAAVMPIVDRYLSDLETSLADLGYVRDLYIMQSNGGMMMSQEIRKFPVNIIESGPAAGVVAAMAIGRMTNRANLLSFDMGGTTAKAALVHKGRVEMTSEYEVSPGGHGTERQEGYPIRIPVMDIAEVGAGGGSIAWIDSGGALRVGPKSAGAAPGPVCYRRGGTHPTTTDANLVLGRLSADYFLGGDMLLDIEGARASIKKHVADPLGMDVAAAALGILDVSNSHMVRVLRRVSIEKGRHPRDYTMVAFGGAGPLQAVYLANELGVSEVIVPQFPGVASALGMLGSDVRYEYREAYFSPLLKADTKEITARFKRLVSKAEGELKNSGIAKDSSAITASADLRYVGQAYEICVQWPSFEIDADSLPEIVTRFHDEHNRLYSFFTAERAVEIVSLRVSATGKVAKPDLPKLKFSSAAPPKKAERMVVFRELGAVQCPVYERSQLAAGQVVQGPAVVEQRDSTTLVPPKWSAASDEFGYLILARSKAV